MLTLSRTHAKPVARLTPARMVEMATRSMTTRVRRPNMLCRCAYALRGNQWLQQSEARSREFVVMAECGESWFVALGLPNDGDFGSGWSMVQGLTSLDVDQR